MAFNSYAEVQAFFAQYVEEHSIDIDGSPHEAFWDFSYDDFVNGNVPNVLNAFGQKVKILQSGDSANSNIVNILKGSISGFRQMPANGPFMSEEQVGELAGWIDNNCPEK